MYPLVWVVLTFWIHLSVFIVHVNLLAVVHFPSELIWDYWSHLLQAIFSNETIKL